MPRETTTVCQPASFDVFRAAQLTQARIVVTHRIANGEIRTRVGRVMDIRAVRHSLTPNYIVLEEETRQGVRSFYIENVIGEVLFV